MLPLPLSTRRIATQSDDIAVAIEQLNSVIPALGDTLTVSVGDTTYNRPKFIQGIEQHKHLVHISRLQNNRIINRTASKPLPKITHRRTRGHERWYGAAFNLKDESTWGTPAEETTVSYKTRKNKHFTAHIQEWHDRLMPCCFCCSWAWYSCPCYCWCCCTRCTHGCYSNPRGRRRENTSRY